MSFIIVTPDRKWIQAAKNPAKTLAGDVEAVSGYYRRTKGGITFFDLTGIPFAFLVTNRHGERFFVSCSTTTEGIRYQYSTMTCDEVKLGIHHLGHSDCSRLAKSIVEEMDLKVASEALANAGLTIDDMANMANNLSVSNADYLAMDRAGLSQSFGGESYLTSVGRIMLSRNGYEDTVRGWTKVERAESIAAH